ncbi:MAG: tetratricopeptide repeat protein [Nitrospirae bacterium]|nr:tetratricopeptide repeat protein [Nitrospirota bacterium]
MKEKMPGLEEFQLGTAYLKEKNYKEAAHYFRKALLFYQENPNQTPGSLLSSYGYATAMGENQIKEGVAFCKKGIQRKDQVPEQYLYLAELCLINRRKGEAYQALEDGLKIFKNNSRLSQKIKEFGVRKKPLLPILERSHPVNKVLGKILREPISKR